MAIEFIEKHDCLLANDGMVTVACLYLTEDNQAVMNERLTISDLEQILCKMKELQGGNK